MITPGMFWGSTMWFIALCPFIVNLIHPSVKTFIKATPIFYVQTVTHLWCPDMSLVSKRDIWSCDWLPNLPSWWVKHCNTRVRWFKSYNCLWTTLWWEQKGKILHRPSVQPKNTLLHFHIYCRVAVDFVWICCVNF